MISYAVAKPGTVMVHFRNAFVANLAVVSAVWLPVFAGLAKLGLVLWDLLRN
jgi:hypothetical protein